MGAMAPEALRLELGSPACVIAILTPNSIANDWVLFELGVMGQYNTGHRFLPAASTARHWGAVSGCDWGRAEEANYLDVRRSTGA